jgi:DNA-directed RNA polymerase II subunit RPB2
MLNMYGASSRTSVDGHQIRATIPYVREDVPVVVIFRALGYVADRDIIEHIVYDFEGTVGFYLVIFKPYIVLVLVLV